ARDVELAVGEIAFVKAPVGAAEVAAAMRHLEAQRAPVRAAVRPEQVGRAAGRCRERAEGNDEEKERDRPGHDEVFSRRVTNSSAAVGWMPMVASNCALVAPSFTAIATPWMISPASAPIMCAPTTRWLLRSTTSFMKVRSFLPVSVSFSARNEAL